jgi:ubiquinone/menaquinone biosynthesis C-methylase UbiE
MRYNSKKYAFLRYFDKYLFRTIQKHLAPQPGEKILEIGCNRGALVMKMQEHSLDAYGVDINPEAIKYGFTNNLFVADATSLPFPDDSFDKVYSVHTIEHIPDIKKSLREMERILKPGGRIVLIYPAELIRGMFALRSAIFVYKKIASCREVHIHKLFPKKIKEIIAGLKLSYVESHFPVLGMLQYLTVLEKRV